ncbi:uncharacterized protein BJ212DRAFT_1298130 [Suillus subaureus]|uniref:Uncharacterized protein n=1 Tax=Suillus subaureus TaxID=48587 RepID=A0A9P7EFT1_9AGAM|nr:uncharacterized protein BJ212DRAFT_1298130 [Suillus subaureus]KAG1819692.1 hypothetical protein BJ212DRAFT_1298130 [Suillus subaureus]
MLGVSSIACNLMNFQVEQDLKEFEFESWDIAHMKSIIGARAFTTSQSAQAHFILFQQIFEIASADTGIQTIIADGHKGQGLSLGILHSQVPKDMEIAMLTIASMEPHPDLQGTLTKIKKGGKKAAAWLKDKIEGTKFTLLALYQPNSLIPLEIWKASLTTMNGNEQAHRNVNHDGVGLTLLGGIMQGFHYDENISTSLDLFDAFGINSSDCLSTHAYCAKCALAQHVRHTKSLLSQGNASFACIHLTSLSVKPQPKLIPNSMLMSSSTIVPVSMFSTLTSALTAGAHVADY